MPKPTGQQFVQLYRGLEQASPDTLDAHQMGPHWTTDYGVARTFAGWDSGVGGTVVGALVHKRHIIPEGTPEHDDAKYKWAVSGSDEAWGSWEKEHTVRPGSPIHVTEIKHVPEEGGSTTIERKDIPLGRLRKFRA